MAPASVARLLESDRSEITQIYHYTRCGSSTAQFEDKFEDVDTVSSKIGRFQRIVFIGQGSHSDWKTWKNGKAFSNQGKVREF